MHAGDNRPQRLPLRDGFALSLDEGACLPLRSTHGQCRSCATACPRAALAVSVVGLELSDDCVGCGRCTAACPTQALGLPELEAPDTQPASQGGCVRFECRMVPARAHLGATTVLPCLGSLTAGRLLALAAADCEVELVDRGWCTGCPAQGADVALPHPAQAAVATATLWLEHVGSARQPRWVKAPLPLSQRPDALPPPEQPAPVVDRRRFFRSALERPAGRDRPAATPMGGNGRAAYPADARRPSPERELQRTALQRLTAAQASEMPTEFYPSLHADARCCDRRLCVALCPTAALTAADDGQSSHLQWSADRCIACGTCVRACPESALTLAAHGGTSGWHTLVSHRRARCGQCGDSYTPSAADLAVDAEATCPACAKSRRFMDDARRQLFGAPR